MFVMLMKLYFALLILLISSNFYASSFFHKQINRKCQKELKSLSEDSNITKLECNQMKEDYNDIVNSSASPHGKCKPGYVLFPNASKCDNSDNSLSLKKVKSKLDLKPNKKVTKHEGKKSENHKSKGIISRLKDKVRGKSHKNDVVKLNRRNLKNDDVHKEFKMREDLIRDSRSYVNDEDLMNNYLINMLSLNIDGKVPPPFHLVKTNNHSDPVLMIH